LNRKDFEQNYVKFLEELSKVIEKELSRRDFDLRLLSKEDSEDLIMDISLKIFEEYNKIWKIAQDGGNVDSYIIAIIRNFFTDKQRKLDPIGYKIYYNLITVLKIMVEDGQLFCQKDLSLESIDKFTVFSFIRNKQSNSLPSSNEIQKILKNSNQYYELLKCLGKSGEKNLRVIAFTILSIRDSGIVSFRFKDLIDAVKQKVKELKVTKGEIADIIPMNEKPKDQFPTNSVEEIENKIDIQRFSEFVRQTIRNSRNRTKTKEIMIKVFDEYYANKIFKEEDSPPLKEITRKLELKLTNLSYYLKKLQKEILEPAFKEYYGKELPKRKK